MNKVVRSNAQACLMAALLSLAPLAHAQPPGAQAPMPQGNAAQATASMPLHHLHLSLMDHGLKMLAQGSSIEMVSGMHMDPKVKQDIDSITQEHGKEMFREGKDLIQRALDDLAQWKTQDRGGAAGDTMSYSQSLGTAMLNVANILGSMKYDAPNTQAMTLHHIHLALNHALVMAANGANLVMLGQMGMAPKLDPASIDHGHKMLADAQAILGKVEASDSYKKIVEAELQGKGKPDERPGRTAELAAADKAVVDMLQKMPGAPPAK